MGGFSGAANARPSVDDSTIEYNGSQLRLKAASISPSYFAAATGTFLLGGEPATGAQLEDVTDATVNAGITHYFAPYAGSAWSGNTTESSRQRTVRTAMSVVGLSLNVVTNTLSGNCVVTLRKTGSPTAITFTLAAGVTTGALDVAHQVDFAVGDKWDVQVAAAAGSGSIVLRGVNVWGKFT